MELNQKQTEWLAANQLVLNITHDGFTIKAENAHTDYYRVESIGDSYLTQRMYMHNDCAGPYPASKTLRVHATLNAALKHYLKLTSE